MLKITFELAKIPLKKKNSNSNNKWHFKIYVKHQEQPFEFCWQLEITQVKGLRRVTVIFLPKLRHMRVHFDFYKLK